MTSVVSFNVIFTIVLFFMHVALFVILSHSTVAPIVSKIARIGTIVLPFITWGGTSKLILVSSTETRTFAKVQLFLSRCRNNQEINWISTLALTMFYYLFSLLYWAELGWQEYYAINIIKTQYFLNIYIWFARMPTFFRRLLYIFNFLFTIN